MSRRRLNTVLVIAALLVLVLGLVPFVVGSMLPVEHTSSRTHVFAQPPEDLWPQVVAEFQRGNDGRYRVAIEHAPFELVTEVARPKFFGGTWTYTLTPFRGGTKLTVVERGQVYNPAFRFLSTYVFGQTATLDDYVARLVRAVAPAPGTTSR